MPNHITNYTVITGSKENLDKLVEVTKLKTETSINDNEFDFNGLIPMPEELEETVSPTRLVPTQAEADKINAEHVPTEWNKQKYQVISVEEHQRRVREYGVDNWRDFANSNWGTKWGAYDVYFIDREPEKLTLTFQTAWSCPIPIFDHIQTEFNLEVHCKWLDEDGTNGEYGDIDDYIETWTEINVEYI